MHRGSSGPRAHAGQSATIDAATVLPGVQTRPRVLTRGDREVVVTVGRLRQWQLPTRAGDATHGEGPSVEVGTTPSLDVEVGPIADRTRGVAVARLVRERDRV